MSVINRIHSLKTIYKMGVHRTDPALQNYRLKTGGVDSVLGVGAIRRVCLERIMCWNQPSRPSSGSKSGPNSHAHQRFLVWATLSPCNSPRYEPWSSEDNASFPRVTCAFPGYC